MDTSEKTPAANGGKQESQGSDSNPKSIPGEDTPEIKNDSGQVSESKTYTQEEMNRIAQKARIDGEARVKKRIEEDQELESETERVKQINGLLENNKDLVSSFKPEYVERIKKADPEKVKTMFESLSGQAPQSQKKEDNSKEKKDSDSSGEDSGDLDPLQGTGDGGFESLSESERKLAEGIEAFKVSGFRDVDALTNSLDL